MYITVTIHIYTLCIIYIVTMKYTNLIAIVGLVLVMIPGASASWFNETSAGLFTDVEDGLKDCVLALVGICLIGSGVALVVGWFGHNNTLFKKGVYGFGIIAGLAIIYFLAVEIFNYFVTKYW